MDQTQDARTERATIALSRKEKQALRFVSIHRGTTESDLLRDRTMAGIVTEYDELMSALAQLRNRGDAPEAA